MGRIQSGRRADYRWFHPVHTRWMDNDPFRHVNNANYLSYFDTAVTYCEITEGIADLLNGPLQCVVAEVMCRYHHPVAFPDRLSIGLRVARIGGSSVRFELGVFRNEEQHAAAEGYFVHVFVDAATLRPVPIPEPARAKLRQFAVGSQED